MELDLLRHRLDKRDQLAIRLNTQSGISTAGLNIDGIGIAATIQVDTAAKKVCELGVVILIILGRWLLPRGRMTRDQLSNLLLGYVGMGADILELFAALTEPEVMYNRTITYVTLVLFSWSMLQFCIVATATAGSEDSVEGTRASSVGAAYDPSEDKAGSRLTSVIVEAWNSDSEVIPGTSDGTPSHIAATSTVPRSVTPPTSGTKTPSSFVMSADLFQILAALLMQDGPFFFLRFGLWISYGVSSEIHIFFTAKNALTVILMLYRLYSLILDAYNLPHLRAALYRVMGIVTAAGTTENITKERTNEQAV